jgi:hypothetical protein
MTVQNDRGRRTALVYYAHQRHELRVGDEVAEHGLEARLEDGQSCGEIAHHPTFFCIGHPYGWQEMKARSEKTALV